MHSLYIFRDSSKSFKKENLISANLKPASVPFVILYKESYNEIASFKTLKFSVLRLV